MRRAKYLNAILTVNALALCLLVAIFATDRGSLTPSAKAAEQMGIPDAGAQRYEMIRQLRAIVSEMQEMRKDLAKQEFTVKVVSMPPAASPSE